MAAFSSTSPKAEVATKDLAVPYGGAATRRGKGVCERKRDGCSVLVRLHCRALLLMKTLLVLTFNELLKQEVYLLAAPTHTHMLITDTILDTTMCNKKNKNIFSANVGGAWC